MHPYLVKLDIRKEVQFFFEPFYHCDEAGNLVFCYGGEKEHFGLAWHRVPRATHWWQAGEESSARQVLICASAMEAISFLSVNYHRYPVQEELLFIALGTYPSPDQLSLLRQRLRQKKVALVFDRGILGRLQDIAVAAGLSGNRIRIKYMGKEVFEITYQGRNYRFHQAALTLSLFQKTIGRRWAIRTHKAKGAACFLQQLTHPFIKH